MHWSLALSALHSPHLGFARRAACKGVWRGETSGAYFGENATFAPLQFIAMYAPDAACKVYCQNCYWSDNWDQYQSGRDIDFSRPFFEQFAELLQQAPVPALINVRSENSEYCNRIFDGRNNYLSFIALYNPEGLLYTSSTQSCKDCVDILFCQHSELCYDCVDCESCHAIFYSTRAIDCYDSYFLEDCIGCHDCFACKNLQRRAYCVFNEQIEKEEYQAFLREAKLSSWSSVRSFREKAVKFFQTLPSRALVTKNSENVHGSNIFYSRECKDVFDAHESERMLSSSFFEKCNDCADCYGLGCSHHSYDSTTLQNSEQIFFSAAAIDSAMLTYCYECYANSKNCFGSVGLKKGEWSILNQIYSKAEYQKLIPRLLGHMNRTGEWGEFFPAKLSPFAYNESTAQDDYPLVQEEALALGLRWQEQLHAPPKVSSFIKAEELPDNATEATQDLLRNALLCEFSGQPFRVIENELKFYLSQGVPIPRLHPDERHRRRLERRNPRKLFDRSCALCSEATQSTISPNRAELLYCEPLLSPRNIGVADPLVSERSPDCPKVFSK